MSDTIVDVRDLRKVYRGWSWGRRRHVEAVRGVTLQANAGEVFGLLGPNGAGKTTLIKILLGVVKPSGGSATLFNLPAGSRQARRRVGYLPESLRVDRHHTARTALRYYGRMSGMSGKDIARRSDELLELVGLQGRDRESVRRFSKGMYQRLGLAQALMHDPDLLVLDEPTDGLDPVGRNEVRQVIERLSQAGKTIFLNSHILQEVELVCSRVAILAAGQIKIIGAIDELAHADQTQVVIQVCPEPNRVDTDTTNAESVRNQLQLCLTETASDSATIVPIGGGEGWTLTAQMKSQTEIDRIVDALREHHFSIRHLQIVRPSLEETFMRLVGQTELLEVNEMPAVNELPADNEVIA